MEFLKSGVLLIKEKKRKEGILRSGFVYESNLGCWVFDLL